MNRIASTTVNALTKLGEKIERRFSTGEDETYKVEDSDDEYEVPRHRSAFQRPFDKDKERAYDSSSSKKRNSIHQLPRNHSADNLAASPSPYAYSNKNRQTPVGQRDGFPRGSYGNNFGTPVNYGYQGAYGNMSAATPYGAANGSVGYAPDYYIAERRQLELVPAPPPRIIQQNVPVPVPVDRPVPQPYAVEVPRLVPVDRPVPVPVPTPVPVDRPVAVPVDRPVPQPYPVEVIRQVPVDRPVPVPVPTPVPYPVAVPTAAPPVQVPCYVPVPVPVPSPPPSPVMIENTVTQTQRWVTNSPNALSRQQSVSSVPSVVTQTQQYVNGVPVAPNQSQQFATNVPPVINVQQYPYGTSYAMNQQPYFYNAAAYMNQPSYRPGSPMMGMNSFSAYGANYFSR